MVISNSPEEGTLPSVPGPCGNGPSGTELRTDKARRPGGRNRTHIFQQVKLDGEHALGGYRV